MISKFLIVVYINDSAIQVWKDTHIKEYIFESQELYIF